MKVSEFMHTPAVTCPAKMTVGEVARLMSDRCVGCVLVVDEVGYLAGIVTDRDLALRVLGKGHSADIPITEVMTRDVATISNHADISTAAAIMATRTVRRLPVVDAEGQLAGIVAVDDLIDIMAEQLRAMTQAIAREQAREARTRV